MTMTLEPSARPSAGATVLPAITRTIPLMSTIASVAPSAASVSSSPRCAAASTRA